MLNEFRLPYILAKEVQLMLSTNAMQLVCLMEYGLRESCIISRCVLKMRNVHCCLCLWQKHKLSLHMVTQNYYVFTEKHSQLVENMFPSVRVSHCISWHSREAHRACPLNNGKMWQKRHLWEVKGSSSGAEVKNPFRYCVIFWAYSSLTFGSRWFVPHTARSNTASDTVIRFCDSEV